MMVGQVGTAAVGPVYGVKWERRSRGSIDVGRSASCALHSRILRSGLAICASGDTYPGKANNPPFVKTTPSIPGMLMISDLRDSSPDVLSGTDSQARQNVCRAAKEYGAREVSSRTRKLER